MNPFRFSGFAFDLLRSSAGGKRPFKLTYIVTDECSCRCAVCNLWQAPRRGAGAAEIERLFAANPHLSWINLSGGEVVERDDFASIVDAAVRRTRVYVLDFPTAGQRPGVVEEAVRTALRTPLPRLFVTVSIDGPRRTHDRLRGTPGAFDAALETIRRLRSVRDRRMAVRVGLTFSSRNDRDPERLVGELLRDAPGLRREDLHYNIAHHAPHYYRNRPADRPDPTRLAAFFAAEAKRRPVRTPLDAIEQVYWRIAIPYLRGERVPVACSALKASAYVDPDLTLYPCASWDLPLCNLRDFDYSITRALRAAAAVQAQRDAEKRRCPGCWTPCEAYPNLVARPATAARAAFAAGPRGAVTGLASPGGAP